MRKLCVVLGFIISGSVLLAGCGSAPRSKPAPLGPEAKNVTISDISVVINQKLDNEEVGKKFIKRLCEEDIDKFTEILLVGGIVCDVKAFKDEYNNSPQISFEEADLNESGVIHHYTWKTHAPTTPGHNLVFNFVLMENGQVNIKYLII